MGIKKLLHKMKTMPGRIPMNILYYHALWLNKLIPDEMYVRMIYRVQFGKKLDLDDPKTFNEKLNWAKLYDRNPEYTKMVDKIAVRDYIEAKLGPGYAVPLLGIYKSFDEIPFDNLPDQFVIKTNHDSAGYVICKDKKTFDIESAKKKLNKHLARNYFWMGREWPYKNIKPQLLVEEYMQDGDKEDLNDWKFYCANGKPFLFYTTFERGSKRGLSMNYYNMDGSRIPVRHCNYPNYDGDLVRPENFEEMVRIAEKLSEGISFVRVDLYEVNGKVYFGELTFFPGCGIEGVIPDDYDRIWGDMIGLPEKHQ